jgi:hypothetical protein
MLSAGFEPAIQRPQTYALARSVLVSLFNKVILTNHRQRLCCSRSAFVNAMTYFACTTIVALCALRTLI